MYYKQLLIIIVSLTVGYMLGRKPDHRQDIGQSKSVTVSKTRYFFIGYCIGGKADGNMGWHTVDGDGPKKTEVFEFIKKSCPEISFQINELVIVGLHEFKSKYECDQFFEMQKQK